MMIIKISKISVTITVLMYNKMNAEYNASIYILFVGQWTEVNSKWPPKRRKNVMLRTKRGIVAKTKKKGQNTK